MGKSASVGANDSEKVELTACIPTYNRGRYVEPLVSFLCTYFEEARVEGIEVLVVDNLSSDDTRSRLKGYEQKYSFLRIVTNPTHYDTAEENMFRAVQHCRGEYIWFLGDDDLPRRRGMEVLLMMVLDGQADLLLFNSSDIEISTGALLSDRAMRISGEFIDVERSRIPLALGPCTIAARVSILVVKKQYVDMELAYSLLEAQAIYAHSLWVLGSFIDKKVRLVSEKLIDYRRNDFSRELKHLQSYQEGKGHNKFWAWGFGFGKQLQLLEKLSSVRYADLGRMIETNLDGSRFRRLDEVVLFAYKEIIDRIDSGESFHESIARDVSELADLVEKIDLNFYEELSALRGLVALWRDAGVRMRLSKKALLGHRITFSKAHESKVHQRYFDCLEAGNLLGYYLYETPGGYLAISDNSRDALDRALYEFDGVDIPPHILYDDNYENLVSRIREYRAISSAALTKEAFPAVHLAGAMKEMYSQYLDGYRKQTAFQRGLWKFVIAPLWKVSYKVRPAVRYLIKGRRIL